MAVKSESWGRIEEIFDRAVAAPVAQRAALLDEACGNDAALRAEVESLLEHDPRAGDDFLASPVVALRHPDRSAPEWVLALVGKKIGRYTVVRLVGHGGMGCVYEAMQERPARTVALKVRQPGFSTPSALARFRVAPEVLGRLQHPNIAQVFEAGVHEDETGAVPYFAMEFIPDAQPLLEYADAHELTTRRRLELFAKVCDAIHHGHQKGVIHRDIKPANILVGAGGEPKVIDFGVARASDADIVMTTQCTHVGDLVGTVHYMSPEQCDGNPAAIDTRSDIYSLGVVLYELLTGAAPYDTSGTTVYGAIRVIKEEPPRRPSAVFARNDRTTRRHGCLARELRGNLDAILLKALEKDPTRRYVSAADLAHDVRRHLAGELVEARRASAWQRLLRWAGRRPRAAATLGTLALCGLILSGSVGGAWAYRWHYVRQPDRLEYDDGAWRPQVRLLNRLGVPIHTWSAGRGGSINARLIRPYADDPGRRFAVLGFTADSSPDRACQLQLFDLGGDLKRAVWTRQLAPDDLPGLVHDAGFRADQFGPGGVYLSNVFHEAHGPQVDEIVCQYSHNRTGWRALCIYDIAGKLLYRVWNDGGIYGYHWMSGPGLLVVAGENQELRPGQRGCPPSLGGGQEILIVFALRPELDATEPRMIDWTRASDGGELVWYKWVGHCPIPGIGWRWYMVPPPDGDPSSTVELGLTFATDPQCGMSWRVDENGNCTSPIIAPQYREMRDSNPNLELPAPEAFQLQDSPPGE